MERMLLHLPLPSKAAPVASSNRKEILAEGEAESLFFCQARKGNGKPYAREYEKGVFFPETRLFFKERNEDTLNVWRKAHNAKEAKGSFEKQYRSHSARHSHSGLLDHNKSKQCQGSGS